MRFQYSKGSVDDYYCLEKNLLGLIKESLCSDKRISQSINNINKVIRIPTTFIINKVLKSEFNISLNELKK